MKEGIESGTKTSLVMIGSLHRTEHANEICMGALLDSIEQNAKYCNTLQCNATNCNTMQCIAMQ